MPELKPHRVRAFAVTDPTYTLCEENFDDEAEARTTFAQRSAHAEENGGGYDLIIRGERIARVAVHID